MKSFLRYADDGDERNCLTWPMAQNIIQNVSNEYYEADRLRKEDSYAAYKYIFKR